MKHYDPDELCNGRGETMRRPFTLPAKHGKILDVVGPVKTTVELEPALFLPKGNPALQKIEKPRRCANTPRHELPTKEAAN